MNSTSTSIAGGGSLDDREAAADAKLRSSSFGGKTPTKAIQINTKTDAQTENLNEEANLEKNIKKIFNETSILILKTNIYLLKWQAYFSQFWFVVVLSIIIILIYFLITKSFKYLISTYLNNLDLYLILVPIIFIGLTWRAFYILRKHYSSRNKIKALDIENSLCEKHIITVSEFRHRAADIARSNSSNFSVVQEFFRELRRLPYLIIGR